MLIYSTLDFFFYLQSVEGREESTPLMFVAAAGSATLSYLFTLGSLKIEMFIASVLETALPVGRPHAAFICYSLCYCPRPPARKRNHLPFTILPSAAPHHLLHATPVTPEFRDFTISEALWWLKCGSASQDYTLSAEKGHAACAGLCAGCHGDTWR